MADSIKEFSGVFAIKRGRPPGIQVTFFYIQFVLVNFKEKLLPGQHNSLRDFGQSGRFQFYKIHSTGISVQK